MPRSPVVSSSRDFAAVVGALPALAGGVLVAAGALGGAPAAARAQSSTSNLRGVITNSAGAPVSDAQVQVRNLATGVRRGATTNASGTYNVGGLQPGAYEVRVARIGFTPVTQQVRLTVGEITTRDFRLGEAAVQLEAVAVTATRSTDRASSEVAATVSAEQLENLPQNARNFIDFAALAPGVQRRGSGVSSGGVSESNANLFIDGVSFKSDLLPGGVAGQDPGLGGRDLRGATRVTGNPFPQSAVQEFRVVTQNYKAEYQRASGAVVSAATKTGGNEVSGDLFFFGQNRGLLARPYYDRLDNIARPDYGRAQFGGSVGGPIVRDRAHFFASFEGNYIDLNQRTVFRPPSELRAQIPDSLLRGQNTLVDLPFRSNLFFGKVDYALSDRAGLIFSSTVRRDQDRRGPNVGVGIEAEQRVRNQVDNHLLRHTYNAGAATNELQLGFQRQTVNDRGVAGDAPRLVYDQYNVVRGSYPSVRQFRQDKFIVRNDLTYTLGTHVLKGGVIGEFLRYNLDKRNNELPEFVFRPAGVGNPAGLGIDVPVSAALEVGSGIVRERNEQLGAFVQDDWTVARRLTLNLGVRYDVETNALNNNFRTPQVVRDSIGAFLRTYPFFDGERYFNDGPRDRRRFLGGVQPRFGFSYDVAGTGRTLVFGGAGVFYDRIYSDILLDERLRVQRPRYNFFFRRPGTQGPANSIDFTPALLQPGALAALVQSGQANRPEAFLIPDDLRPPRSDQFNLGVRHQVGGYQLSLTGTAVNGRNAFRYVWGQRDIRPGAEFGAFRPIPGFSAILRGTDGGRSWYRALLFQASRPLTEQTRWGGDLSYTLASTEVNTRNEDAFALDYVSEADFRDARIRSRYDERHRVVLNLVARIPLGIRASTLTTLGSGLPYISNTACDETQARQQQLLAGTPDADTRARLQYCQANGYFGNGNGAGWDDNPPGRTGVFGSQPERRWFGPFGRWAFRQVDLRLQKDVPLPRGQRASVSVDVFNVFNFDNFNYEGFEYNTYFDRNRAPLPFSTFQARQAQLGVRYSL